MSKVEEIEKAVSNLTPYDLARFAAWFEAFAAERFDDAIEHDARSGALDHIIDAALADFREGKATPL